MNILTITRASDVVGIGQQTRPRPQHSHLLWRCPHAYCVTKDKTPVQKYYISVNCLPKRAMRKCRLASICNASRGWHAHVALIRPFSTSRASRQHFTISKLLSEEQPVDDVEVHGWVRTLRKQKRIAFLALGDGSAYQPLQAVLTPEQSEG